MKRIFLLFSASVLAFGAQAQLANSSLVRLNTKTDSKEARGLRTAPVPEGRPTIIGNGTANKGAGLHTRNYNYVDYLATSINTSLFTTAGIAAAPYMWYNPDMYGIYTGATGGDERDTINLVSVGTTLQPTFSGYNTVDYDNGTMVITDANNYTVDSVIAYGLYMRNPAKTNIVDTLRFALTYGNGGTSNIGLYYYTGMMSRYGYDTVRAAIPTYDPIRHTLGAKSGGTGTVIYRDVYLRSTDTTSFKGFGVATSLAIPAGNLVAASVTFRSGEVYTPYTDTAYRGVNINAAVPYKYGMFRPYVYRQDATAFPTYTPGNYNAGQFETLPDTDPAPTYAPTWAWTGLNNTAASYQFPYIDYVISCATCAGVGVKNVSPAVVGSAFPNPATNTVTLPITMKQAGNVNVTMTNLVGQTMATQKLGNIAASQKTTATFSTSGIANGVYFLTVEANGARTTSRFVVAH